MRSHKRDVAYQKALEWIEDHNPLEVLDGIEEAAGYDIEGIYTEFPSVYYDKTNAKDYPFGTYSPGRWGLRATFIFGYEMGLAAARKGEQA